MPGGETASVSRLQRELNDLTGKGKRVGEVATYTLDRMLGSGSYGDVAAGKHDQTDDPVAVKKIKEEIFEEGHLAQRIYRELRCMQHLHWSVIGEHRAAQFCGLRDLVVPRSPNFASFWMVMDLCDCDLRMIVGQGRFKGNGTDGLEPAQLRYMLFQLLHALKTLKDSRILHRDIQAANVLVNCSTADVKLCDFGLSCGMCPEPKEPKVVMQWYRPPELLLKSWHYDYQVDVWGVGCVFGDLLCLYGWKQQAHYYCPLFRAQPVGNDTSLNKICKLLGCPSPEELRRTANVFEPSERAVRGMVARNEGRPRVDWSEYFRIERSGPAAPALSLVDRMLQFDPRRRATVESLLQDKWFESLHVQYTEDEKSLGPVPPFDQREDGNPSEDDLGEWKKRIFELSQQAAKQSGELDAAMGASVRSAGVSPGALSHHKLLQSGASPLASTTRAQQSGRTGGEARPLLTPQKTTREPAAGAYAERSSCSRSESRSRSSITALSDTSVTSAVPPTECAALLALIGEQLEHGREKSEVENINGSARLVWVSVEVVRPALKKAGFDPVKGKFPPMSDRRWQALAARIRRMLRPSDAAPPAWERPSGVQGLPAPAGVVTRDAQRPGARPPQPAGYGGQARRGRRPPSKDDGCGMCCGASKRRDG